MKTVVNTRSQFKPISSAILVFLLLIVAGCGGTEEKPEIWSLELSVDYGFMPRWNSEGTRLVFGDSRAGNSRLCVMNGEGAVEEIGSEIVAHNWDYCWSPNGERIALSSPAAPDDSTGGVWVIELASGMARRVVDRGRDVCWGDSGNAIYFEIENPVGGVPGIYALSLTDSIPRLIAERGVKPAARPFSNQVAYADGSIDGRIWLASEESAPIRVSERGAIQWKWSGDGTQLFAVLNDYATGIVRGHLWRYQGVDLIQSDSLASSVSSVTVNRNGSLIVFTRSSGATWLGIWITRNGDEVKISPVGENPELHPATEKIAYNLPGGGIRILTRTQ